MANLRFDFYESGIGETIIITFPQGDLGLVDAHPSQNSLRPEILKLIEGKRLRFVCLTHPHADHGVDLLAVLQRHAHIDAFWHTVFDLPAFIYGIEQFVNFPSAVREHAAKMNQDWGAFLFDIYAAVIERKIPRHELRSDLIPEVIDGVEIHCLSPDESLQNVYFSTYRRKLADPGIEIPDTNLISAVLALKLGESVVLLGADALKRNWESVVKHYSKRALPKAIILKVPHHGARNALNLQRKQPNYLDLCSHSPKATAVIFAGDSKHPDPDVFAKLRSRTTTICLSNGRKSKLQSSNPLHLQIPNARAVGPARVCNPVVSFELNAKGDVSLLAGIECESGCFAPAA